MSTNGNGPMLLESSWPRRVYAWIESHCLNLLAGLIMLLAVVWQAQAELGPDNAFLVEGWPWSAFQMHSAPPGRAVLVSVSWSAVLLDFGTAVGLFAMAWMLIARTQRRFTTHERFSLATLMAFVALIALACCILTRCGKLEPPFGWRTYELRAPEREVDEY